MAREAAETGQVFRGSENAHQHGGASGGGYSWLLPFCFSTESTQSSRTTRSTSVGSKATLPHLHCGATMDQDDTHVLYSGRIRSCPIGSRSSRGSARLR